MHHQPLRELHSEVLIHTQGRPLRGSVFVRLKMGTPEHPVLKYTLPVPHALPDLKLNTIKETIDV